MQNKTHRRALVISTTVLAAGIAASLAGNLQAINLSGRTPGIGAYISATWWPLALFGVIEIMLHTPWLRNWRDGWTKVVAVGLVGVMAAYISYFHLAHTLSAYGYDVASRYMGPLAIDAAMAMATLSLNRVGHARRAASLAALLPPSTPVDEVVDKPEQETETNPDSAPTDTPAETPDAPKTRRPRGTVAPEQIQAVQMIINGAEKPSVIAVTEISSATYGRLTKVWRILKDNPHTAIDASAEKVRPELIDTMREAARLESVR